MVRNRLAEDDAVKGFLLDGFPRNVPQAEVLGEMLDDMGTKLDVVLELVVDDDEVVRRLSGRRTCRNCGTIWHVDFDPPAVEGICDRCEGELFQRDDDLPETVRHRLEVYAEQTAPLVAYYAERGLLIGIDATGPVDDITDRALDALRHFSD
jgi:adenylate kinase